MQIDFFRTKGNLIIYFTGSHNCKLGNNAVDTVADVINRAKSVEGIFLLFSKIIERKKDVSLIWYIKP